MFRSNIGRKIWTIVFGLCAAGWCGSHAEAMTLVEDGKPAATIVVRQAALEAEPGYGVYAPDSKVRWAAEDLQQYIEKMSGAKLPIVGDGATVEGPRILVGASKLTAAFREKIPAGLTLARREDASRGARPNTSERRHASPVARNCHVRSDRIASDRLCPRNPLCTP